MAEPFKVGITSCILHALKHDKIYKGRKLNFIDESLSHFLMKAGFCPVIIPNFMADREANLRVLKYLDGVVIHGGVDVSPLSYGEKPIKEEWSGDLERDKNELQIIELCLQENIPVFAICRGIQILNVAFGGTLYQDLSHQNVAKVPHRQETDYINNSHGLRIFPKSILADVFGHGESFQVNSMHHQGVKDLGENLIVNARSHLDELVESFHLKQKSEKSPFCFGVQWHPEFQNEKGSHLLDPGKIIRLFSDAIKMRKKNS